MTRLQGELERVACPRPFKLLTSVCVAIVLCGCGSAGAPSRSAVPAPEVGLPSSTDEQASAPEPERAQGSVVQQAPAQGSPVPEAGPDPEPEVRVVPGWDASRPPPPLQEPPGYAVAPLPPPAAVTPLAPPHEAVALPPPDTSHAPSLPPPAEVPHARAYRTDKGTAYLYGSGRRRYGFVTRDPDAQADVSCRAVSPQGTRCTQAPGSSGFCPRHMSPHGGGY